MRKSGFFPRLALVNLLRNGRYYGPYLLSCSGTAAMFYILRYLTESDIVASVRGAAYLQSLMYLGCSLFRRSAALCQQLRHEAASAGAGTLQHPRAGKTTHRPAVSVGDPLLCHDLHCGRHRRRHPPQ